MPLYHRDIWRAIYLHTQVAAGDLVLNLFLQDIGVILSLLSREISFNPSDFVINKFTFCFPS